LKRLLHNTIQIDFHGVRWFPFYTTINIWNNLVWNVFLCSSKRLSTIATKLLINSDFSLFKSWNFTNILFYILYSISNYSFDWQPSRPEIHLSHLSSYEHQTFSLNAVMQFLCYPFLLLYSYGIHSSLLGDH
jgi:hypothetical protein